MRKKRINKSSPFFTFISYDLYVIRSNDNAGVVANVLRELFIQPIIYRKFFFTGFPENASCFFLFTPNLEFALKPEAIMALQNIVAIYSREIAFGETEVVNSIQQVRFPDAIPA